MDNYNEIALFMREAGSGAFGTSKGASIWHDNQRKLLLDSNLDCILVNITRWSIAHAPGLGDGVWAYLETNRDSMDYKRYRGLLIGSDVID